MQPDQRTTVEATGKRRPSPMALMFIGLIGLAAVISLAIATGSEQTDRLANKVLLLPTPTPDDLELSGASMWTALGSETGDPEEAASISLSFKEMKADDAAEPVLSIVAEDRLGINSARLEHDTIRCFPILDDEEIPADDDCRRRVEESQCSGLGPIEEGELDVEACIEEEITRVRSFVENPPEGAEELGNSVLNFDELVVREKPALRIQLGGIVTVITFEGGGVISTVTGNGLPSDLVVDIAGRLHPTSPDEYTALTARQ